MEFPGRDNLNSSASTAVIHESGVQLPAPPSWSHMPRVRDKLQLGRNWWQRRSNSVHQSQA